MMINKSPLMVGQAQGTPFLFRKRSEKIDWRRLAAVDVNRVASQMDIDTLQEILTSVAFCDITSEIDTRYVDTNFIKLFQLAQLLVEYLLYSQEYLTGSVNTLKEENDGLKKTITELQDQLVEKSNRLTVVRRECHRRRLLLLAQQQLMDSGPQSYHRCMFCTKAFLNASFLAAHVHRRHPETEVSKQKETIQQTGQVNQPTVLQPPQYQASVITMETEQIQNNNTTTTLEREVRELLDQLKPSAGRLSPSKAVMFINSPRLPSPEKTMETSKPPAVEQEPPKQPDWQAVMMEEHRREMELIRNMFEKEIRVLQAQHAATQDELAQLKVKRAASNLGELVDDVPSVKCTERAHLSTVPSEATDASTMVQVVPILSQKRQPKDVTDQDQIRLNSSNDSRPNRGEYQQADTRRRALIRNHSTEPPSRIINSDEDAEVGNDNAESDITYPVRDVFPRHSRRAIRTRLKRNWPEHDSDFTDLEDIDGRHRSRDETRHARRRRHRRKRVRSTAIQVGYGRPRKERKSNVAVASLSGDEPVFLKIHRPHSRSGSSTPIRYSVSPSARWHRGASLDGRLREIVIVRTEDEDGSGDRRHFDTGSERSSLRSVHLMPTPAILRPRSIMQRQRVTNVGASARSALPEEMIQPVVGQAIPVGDEPTLSASKASIRSEMRTISEHVSKHSAPSPMRPTPPGARSISAKQRLSQSPLRTSQVAETDDTADESENQQVSNVMGRALTVSGASSPAQSVNASMNILRYSRLLDQLRADPETLRGLRHEVEQLLIEQLSERGIQTNQTRLTTTELNNRLIILRRERENLARKHANFFEIREALAQHVDRLANAIYHGKTLPRTSSSDLRSYASRNQRASVIARAGLPPPSATHSPLGVRKAGTLPMPVGRGRPDTTSGLGSSMPTLVQQHMVASKLEQLHASPSMGSKPYIQRSSPQLHVEERQPEDIHSSRSAVNSASPHQRSQMETPPVRQDQLSSHVKTPSPRKARKSPQRSRSSASPFKTADKPSILKSPSIQLSQDQRVLTFNQPEPTSRPVAETSSDEWDSEPEEPIIPSAKNNETNVIQLGAKRSTGEAPDVLGSGVDLDEADRFLNELSERQRNSNALFTQDSPVAAPIPIQLNRAHSVRTDDEDICSVSSINGGLADDTSLSLVPGTPTKRNSLSNTPRVSRSLDPGVAVAKAQMMALGPRPGTRFGPSARQAVSVAGTAPGLANLGSPDMTNTMPTSVWATNSKGVSLSTNINSGLKSENIDDEDFDTDE